MYVHIRMHTVYSCILLGVARKRYKEPLLEANASWKSSVWRLREEQLVGTAAAETMACWDVNISQYLQ